MKMHYEITDVPYITSSLVNQFLCKGSVIGVDISSVQF